MASNIKISNNDNEIKDNSYDIEIQSSPTLIAEYNEDAIRQSNLIIKNAIFMIWVGILLIIGSFVVYAVGLTKDLVVGTISGSFIDIFSGTILYLFNKTDQDKQNYFNNLAKMENDRKFMDLIRDSKDEEFKKEILSKLIDSNYKNQQ